MCALGMPFGLFEEQQLDLLAAVAGRLASGRWIGFDTFDQFPRAHRQDDQRIIDHIAQTAGLDCIGADQLHATLAARGRGLEANVRLVPGDVVRTVPTYVDQHPELAIALLLIDTDLYEPAVSCLPHLVPRVTAGGVVVVDNYGVFPDETDHPDTMLQRTSNSGHFTHFVVDRL